MEWLCKIKETDIKTNNTTMDNDKMFNISGRDYNYKYVCALQNNFKIYEIMDLQGEKD